MVDVNYSIVIPHRNIPHLLQRCIDSIPCRDDIQIIVVDDNSDPTKVDFAHFPGKNNPNVELYFTKEGKGAGYARNIGLMHAKGKWLLFADADDYFTKNAFKVFDEQFNNEAEIVYFFSESVYDDTGETADRSTGYNSLIENFLKGIISEVQLRVRFEVPWAKMIKSELINRYQIRFDEVPAANDVYFSTLTGYYAKSIAVINQPVYVVTVNIGSITRRRNYNKSFSQFCVSLRKNAFLKKIGWGGEQKSIMIMFLESVKYKPLKTIYLISLLFRFRQNPFIGCSNWIKTYIEIKKKSKKEKHYYVN